MAPCAKLLVTCTSAAVKPAAFTSEMSRKYRNERFDDIRAGQADWLLRIARISVKPLPAVFTAAWTKNSLVGISAGGIVATVFPPYSVKSLATAPWKAAL